MKNNYEIVNNIAKLCFDKKVYSLDSIKRGIASYTNLLFGNICETEDFYVAEIEFKEQNDNPKLLIKEIFNKVLEEDVRCKIENETNYIREKLYSRAINTVLDE